METSVVVISIVSRYLLMTAHANIGVVEVPTTSKGHF